jgi:extracellular factor (EF) 3-hydroxypalmitic acid methyl ester biosynthesis protein
MSSNNNTITGLSGGEVQEMIASTRNSLSVEFHLPLLRVTRQIAVFESYDLSVVLRTSEVLAPFEIKLRDEVIYSGKATVRSQVNTGASVVCELTLDEIGWQSPGAGADASFGKDVGSRTAGFIESWRKFYQVRPEMKIVTADLQTFLTQLRIWTEQIEFDLRRSNPPDKLAVEKQIAEQLSKSVFPYLDELFDQLERTAARCGEALEPMHAAYVRRQIHPLILCSPFADRTVHKPLGYAGDYEVVNMILRDPHEGSSLYARLLNRWFIKQPPAEAHRNRVTLLTRRLLEETARCKASERSAKFFNLGCGPAKEIQDFMSENAVSDHAEFTLLDFNEETVTHGRSVLESVRTRHNRKTALNFQKKSVAQVLKTRDGGAAGGLHDMVYCAGLFDYLTDAICLRLMNVFYDMLAPGGLLLVTNVDRANPIRHWLGDVLDWHLIYRDAADMRTLKPERASSDEASVCADFTGVNLFLEVRKPLT